MNTAVCPDPGVPSQGMREGDNFQDGETVTFDCKKKYDLLGNATIRCNGGVWNSDAPKCKGNYENKQTLKQNKADRCCKCEIIEWICGTYSLFHYWKRTDLRNYTPCFHKLLHLSSLVGII